jgi:glycosyltransferase involved in cell wall biosynthesis
LTLPAPFFSVIIIAFNRKEFLPRALLSVTNQTLDKSSYEIIVVKNFKDKELDEFLEKTGIISLQRGNEIVGSYLVSAIEASKGDVLVFLDDDDEFFPDKLEYLESLFAENPDASYFHNDRIVIDSSGKEITSRFREEQVRYIRKIGHLIVSKPLPASAANKLIKAAGYGYMSSIAIKKAILSPYLWYLRKIESLQDFFMYYCALISSSNMIIESKRLTKYRVHSKNVSVFQYQSEEELAQNILNFLTREKNALETIFEMATEADALPAILKMINYDLYTRKMNLDMADPNVTRGTVLADSIKYFRYSFRSTLKNQISMFGRSIMYLISPKRTRRFFMRRFSSK